jgi:hypothetical protein
MLVSAGDECFTALLIYVKYFLVNKFQSCDNQPVVG